MIAGNDLLCLGSVYSNAPTIVYGLGADKVLLSTGRCTYLCARCMYIVYTCIYLYIPCWTLNTDFVRIWMQDTTVGAWAVIIVSLPDFPAKFTKLHWQRSGIPTGFSR